MPVRQFFAMLKASRQMHAVEMLELCDVSMIPGCDSKFYAEVKRRYLTILEEEPEVEPEPDRPVMDPKAETTRAAIFDLFAAKKGTL
jgi:hypothetical protein